ncbi:hypothetical protein EQ828_14625 [Ectopseudomonas mendocina]|nr:hypothetical protein [Pseudomonas mendocina]TRO20784.1 hypothetical protein EQ828_14625 [Pseudomonas mendocina]
MLEKIFPVFLMFLLPEPMVYTIFGSFIPVISRPLSWVSHSPVAYMPIFAGIQEMTSGKKKFWEKWISRYRAYKRLKPC